MKESSQWLIVMAMKLLFIFVVVEGFFLASFFAKEYYSRKLIQIHELLDESLEMEISFIQILNIAK